MVKVPWGPSGESFAIAVDHAGQPMGPSGACPTMPSIRQDKADDDDDWPVAVTATWRELQ